MGAVCAKRRVFYVLLELMCSQVWPSRRHRSLGRLHEAHNGCNIPLLHVLSVSRSPTLLRFETVSHVNAPRLNSFYRVRQSSLVISLYRYSNLFLGETASLCGRDGGLPDRERPSSQSTITRQRSHERQKCEVRGRHTCPQLPGRRK